MLLGVTMPLGVDTTDCFLGVQRGRERWFRSGKCGA